MIMIIMFVHKNYNFFYIWINKMGISHLLLNFCFELFRGKLFFRHFSSLFKVFGLIYEWGKYLYLYIYYSVQWSCVWIEKHCVLKQAYSVFGATREFFHGRQGSGIVQLLRFNSALFNYSVSTYPVELWYDPISHDPTWHDPNLHDPTRTVRAFLTELAPLGLLYCFSI